MLSTSISSASSSCVQALVLSVVLRSQYVVFSTLVVITEFVLSLLLSFQYELPPNNNDENWLNLETYQEEYYNVVRYLVLLSCFIMITLKFWLEWYRLKYPSAWNCHHPHNNLVRRLFHIQISIRIFVFTLVFVTYLWYPVYTFTNKYDQEYQIFLYLLMLHIVANLMNPIGVFILLCGQNIDYIYPYHEAEYADMDSPSSLSLYLQGQEIQTLPFNTATIQRHNWNAQLYNLIPISAIDKYLTTTCTKQDISDQDMCGICLEQKHPGVGIGAIGIKMLSCTHVFHYPCIHAWLRKRNKCPMCRSTCIPGYGRPPLPPPTRTIVTRNISVSV